MLVLPGLMASDLSTKALRGWIGRLGYPVVGWALGRNRGPTKEVNAELPALIARLAAEHGTPVSIVGWSLGGIFARRLARRSPRQVRQVISLGSPFAASGRRARRRPGEPGLPALLPAARGRQHAGPRRARSPGHCRCRARRSTPAGTASSTGGPAASSRARSSENVAVRSSHLGMGHDPAVLWVVADRLAQPRDAWRPFERPTRFGLGTLFPAED